MTVEDAVRELTEAVKESYESPESEITYIEAPANPSDGDTLTYDATSGKWVAGAPQSGGGTITPIFTVQELKPNGTIDGISCNVPVIDMCNSIAAGDIFTAFMYVEGGYTPLRIVQFACDEESDDWGIRFDCKFLSDGIPFSTNIWLTCASINCYAYHEDNSLVEGFEGEWLAVGVSVALPG